MSNRIKNLVLFAVIGALVFAAGLWLARRHLPEWRNLEISEDGFYLNRFQVVAAELGFVVVPEAPRVELVAWPRDLGTVHRFLKSGANDWIWAQGRAVVVEVDRVVVRSIASGERIEGHLIVTFSLPGRILGILWEERGVSLPLAPGEILELPPFLEILRDPHETLEAPTPGGTSAVRSLAYKLMPSEPPQYVFGDVAAGVVSAIRSVGSDREIEGDAKVLRTFFWLSLPYVAIFVTMAVVTFQLAFVRRRSSWQVALALSTGSMIFSLLPLAGREPAFWPLLNHLAVSLFLAATLFLLWLGGHSLLESRHHESTRGLAELWQEHAVSLRVGYELTGGFILGLLLGGTQLLVSVSATLAPGVWPTAYSVAIQNPILGVNPFRIAVWTVALVLLAQAVALQLGWRVAGCGAVAALFLSPFAPWGPWYYVTLLTLPVAAIVLTAVRGFGVLGALAASFVGVFAPLGVFAFRHRSWLEDELIASTLVLSSIVGTGILGLVTGFIRQARRRVLPPGGSAPLVFLSHSHEDSAFAQRLDDDLRRAGINVWRYEVEVEFGASFVREIRSALEAAEFVLVVLSKDATTSRWVEWEWDTGVLKDIHGEGHLILLKLEDVDLSRFDTTRRYLDFTDPESYQASLRQLVERLSAHPREED